ncbi:peptidase S8/S53 domain-containing protein, partial [Piptocephalis cylindrospora]
MEPQVPRRHLVSRSAIPAPPFPPPGRRPTLADSLGIHDPGFHRQWHLHNVDNPGKDINVTGVWAQNVTGKGVIVTIIDDGLDYDSADLRGNFYAEGSYDFNDHQALPQPKLSDDLHGTRCAGEIAAMRNDVCGVGVAYDAKVAGVRILSGALTDADEALALNYGYQASSIYSCSWGPPDDGAAVDAPNGIVLRAMLTGVEKGRAGKGTLFVFASGNGGALEDNCNFDGYTNSVYTITIGAVDRNGQHPFYAEVCSGQLAVSFSSGSGGYIFTTDVGLNKCSTTHGGTSAAAPLVAGIYALVLSVRPDLTWRDAQYLLVHTAIPINDPGEGRRAENVAQASWFTNGAGRRYSYMFGYGVADAYRMVEEAKVWDLVGPQTWHEWPTVSVNQSIAERGVNSTLLVKAEEIKAAGIRSLEHVTVKVFISHQRRGDVQVTLYSPHGSISILAPARQRDKSRHGFQNWTFMSVTHWEEPMEGEWTLNVRDMRHPDRTGVFHNWTLRLWGEAEDASFAKLPLHDGSLPPSMVPTDDLPPPAPEEGEAKP